MERISEDDLYTEGEFMSEQDMIDDNYKENLVTYTCIYSSWVPSCQVESRLPKLVVAECFGNMGLLKAMLSPCVWNSALSLSLFLSLPLSRSLSDFPT